MFCYGFFFFATLCLIDSALDLQGPLSQAVPHVIFEEVNIEVKKAEARPTKQGHYHSFSIEEKAQVTRYVSTKFMLPLSNSVWNSCVAIVAALRYWPPKYICRYWSAPSFLIKTKICTKFKVHIMSSAIEYRAMKFKTNILFWRPLPAFTKISTHESNPLYGMSYIRCESCPTILQYCKLCSPTFSPSLFWLCTLCKNRGGGVVYFIMWLMSMYTCRM